MRKKKDRYLEARLHDSGSNIYLCLILDDDVYNSCLPVSDVILNCGSYKLIKTNYLKALSIRIGKKAKEAKSLDHLTRQNLFQPMAIIRAFKLDDNLTAETVVKKILTEMGVDYSEEYVFNLLKERNLQ